MNPKRSAAILLLAAVLCAGCGAQNKQLTLENIRRLSQKGDALTRAQEAVELRGGDIDTFLARQSDHASD